MPITFTINQSEKYFTSKWIGKISDNEILAAYKDFFEGKEWDSGLNEIADLSEVDSTDITNDGIMNLDEYLLIFPINPL